MPPYNSLLATSSPSIRPMAGGTRRRVLLGVSLLVLVGCGQGVPAQNSPTAASDVAFARACDQANDGQRVAVSGYLRLPKSFTGERSIVLRMYETVTFAGSPVGVQIRFGKEANQVDMVPIKYSDNDLSVHLNNGGTAGHGTPVRVAGKMYRPLVAQDFDCALEDVVVEAAG